LFDILRKTVRDSKLIDAATRHRNTIVEISTNLRGSPGFRFVDSFLKVFSCCGSPIFLNLDHNVSGKPLAYASKIVEEIESIVKATAGQVSGYKINFQSLLTFLVAGLTDFAEGIKNIYRESCMELYGVKVEPVVWLDQKLGDIPNTNYQAADILYKLGFDAVHVLPHVGPDSVAAVQLAAQNNQNRGVIQVINMTHSGYEYAKNEYYRKGILRKLRQNTVGKLHFETKLNNYVEHVCIQPIGVVEPANRPYELFKGYIETYREKVLIISIGIGPQGALPGCALYAGATCEGIGRFIFAGANGIEAHANIVKKAELSKHCGLMALSARYACEPYPLKSVLNMMKDFDPKIDERTKDELKKVYMKIHLAKS